MATAQDKVNLIRVHLGETDATNSRWNDLTHLLPYYNLGRREWAKDSKALKATFEQTTEVGATTAGGGRYARYLLDPLVHDIDEVFWDDIEVERADGGEWDEQVSGLQPDTQARPFLYRRTGDAIDLFYAPDAEKILEIFASILPTDLVALTDTESELNDDQSQGAIYFAVAQALEDDDRDGSKYMALFKDSTRKYDRIQNRKGPRRVNQIDSAKWRI